MKSFAFAVVVVGLLNCNHDIPEQDSPEKTPAVKKYVDIRAISGDRDPLDVALVWMRMRHPREKKAALLYFLSEPERSEKALLKELHHRRNVTGVAHALGIIKRESSVPGLISALDIEWAPAREAVRNALVNIGGDVANAELRRRGLIK